MRVMTVLGPVAPEELGITMMHEHILIKLGSLDGTLDDVDLAIDELRSYQEAGGRTIVDVTTIGLGRNVEALIRVARETGLHIVAPTGYYLESGYPRYVYEMSTAALADRMVAEITEGIDGTAVRAGIIGEIGTGPKAITPAEERVFRAAAWAQVRTGAAITTHTYFQELAMDQLAIFEEEGVDLRRVVVGHLGDLRDIEQLRAIARKGAYLGIDHVGLELFQRDHQRARIVARLIREGFLLQILISMDVCFRSRLRWWDGTGYAHLLVNFLPMLRAEGVTESEIETMLIDNPRRVLAFDV
jgi:phosphotriesterase-related protein